MSICSPFSEPTERSKDTQAHSISALLNLRSFEAPRPSSFPSRPRASSASPRGAAPGAAAEEAARSREEGDPEEARAGGRRARGTGARGRRRRAGEADHRWHIFLVILETELTIIRREQGGPNANDALQEAAKAAAQVFTTISIPVLSFISLVAMAFLRLPATSL